VLISQGELKRAGADKILVPAQLSISQESRELSAARFNSKYNRAALFG
jgi:hypothetical protein